MTLIRLIVLFSVLLAIAPGAVAETADERTVARAIAEALARDIGESGSVTLQSAVPAIASPHARIAVDEIDFDPRSRRFTAMVESGLERMQVAGRFVATLHVPVPRQRLAAGRAIEPADIQLVEMEASRLAGDIVDVAEDVVGMAAKRDLAPGQPIRARDLTRPILVAKGAMVTMVLQSPLMTLTAAGRAVEGGGRGDVITVLNLQSKKSVFATITGPNMAVVAPTGMPVVSN
jgi:flagella basal body P-ring formation protein FlgA